MYQLSPSQIRFHFLDVTGSFKQGRFVILLRFLEESLIFGSKADDVEITVLRKRTHEYLHRLSSTSDPSSIHRTAPIDDKDDLNRHILEFNVGEKCHHGRNGPITLLHTHARDMRLRNGDVNDNVFVQRGADDGEVEAD